MGQDKAAVRLAGRTLLDHMLDKLRALGLKSSIAGGASGMTQGTAQGIDQDPAGWVADERSGCGPMSGLSTALRHGQSPLVLLLGIDLPLLSTPLLAAILERARLTGAMATIPRAVGRPQPLCAVYRRQLAGAVERLLQAGTFKMMHGIELAAAQSGGATDVPDVDVLDVFDVETWAAAGAVTLLRPVHQEFLNCNTPADLALAERLLNSEPGLRCANESAAPGGRADIL